MAKTFQYTIKVYERSRLLDELNFMGEKGWELMAWREVQFQMPGNIGVFPATAVQEGLEVIMKKEIETKLPMAVHVLPAAKPGPGYLERVIKAVFNLKA